MSDIEVRATEAILDRVRTQWTACVYTFEAERFTPTKGEAWIRVVVRDLQPGQASHGPIGGRRVERRGEIMAQVFAPLAPSDGQRAALELAGKLRALFELKSITGPSVTVNAFEGALRRIGADEATWYQVNVTIPFTFDDAV